MTGHLSEESVVDMASDEGDPGASEHLLACPECAARVHECRSSLALLEQTEIPEPSPLYWEALRSGVKQKIAQDKRRVSAWTMLVPLAAAAALLLVIWGGPTKPAPVTAPLSLPSWSPLPAAEDDEGLRVLEGVALGAQGEADLEAPAGLAPYLAGLTDEESRALAETLRGRGPGGES